MATLETQIIDEIIVKSRRKMLAFGSTALAGFFLSGVKAADAATTPALTDTDILNFALNLEYLEAEYYTLATAGVTIDDTSLKLGINGIGTTTTGGTVTTKNGASGTGTNAAAHLSCKVPFTDPAIQALAFEIAQEERNHVSFLRGALNAGTTAAAVAQPNLDLVNSFNGLAIAAGIGTSFDPFSDDAHFLLGSYIFEDVGVTAYRGAAPLLSAKSPYLAPAAGIMAVEAYHAAAIRTAIFTLDPTGSLGYLNITQLISTTRARLDGTLNDDVGVQIQPVTLNTTTGTEVTIVDADANGLAFSRSAVQVLKIVTAGGANNMGGFFPVGLNGTIK